nr:PREDICTED: glioma tumor suppressor candidate region gene 1 protein isoform X1 [Latimeria chalumnae]XP_014348797.1 PREDICTED: glioma tumor suppressor candidate region gene 1 protein isoform X1 [Latimeria chalumnae]|eukprot:XP_014348790.1 PREDICTED: glioma tumor suppressor candidate region gene 1 protein isoform X1 [Latimeria chalumnae]
MDDEDGRCLLDVICDPQALNDFLHGSEKIANDDLLDSTGDVAGAFFAGTGLHVQEPSGNHLNSEQNQPSASVDLDFLEDEILGSPSVGGANLSNSDQPCDILQQSLQEANITEQTLEAEAELDLGSFQLPTIQPVVQATPDAAAQIFSGGADLIGLQQPAVLTQQTLMQQPVGAEVVNKTISVPNFIQPVGLGNVTLQQLSNLQALPNGSPSGTLGIGQIQVVGQHVMAINQTTQQLIAKQVQSTQVTTLPVGSYVTQPGADQQQMTLSSAGVSPQSAGLVIPKNLSTATTTLNGNSMFPSVSATQGTQSLAVASSLSSPLMHAQNVIIQRTPTPIQPKPSGVIQSKLFQISPKPYSPSSNTLTIQSEAGLQQQKAQHNMTFVAGKPGQNVVVSGFPPNIPANMFKQPQQQHALAKPMSVHLLNQGGSIVIPAQQVPQAMLQGQNQFVLSGQLAGPSAVQIPQQLSALQANVGGQILTAAHPSGQAHIITSQGHGGQLITNPSLPAQILANQNIAGQLNLGAHILSGSIQLQPNQVGQHTLFPMPVSLAGSLATQTHPQVSASLASSTISQTGQTVIQGVTLPSQVAMLNAAVESASHAVSIQATATTNTQNSSIVQHPLGPGANLLSSASDQPSILTVQTTSQAQASSQPQLSAQQQQQAATQISSSSQPSPSLAPSPDKMAALNQPVTGTVLSPEAVHMFFQQKEQNQQQQHHYHAAPTLKQEMNLSQPLCLQSLPPPSYSAASTTTSSVPASVIVSSAMGPALQPPVSRELTPNLATVESKCPTLLPQFPSSQSQPAQGCQIQTGQPQSKLPGASPSHTLPHPPLAGSPQHQLSQMQSPHQSRPPSQPQPLSRPPSRPHSRPPSQPQSLSRPPSEPLSRSCTPSQPQLQPLFVIQNQVASSPHGSAQHPLRPSSQPQVQASFQSPLLQAETQPQPQLASPQQMQLQVQPASQIQSQVEAPAQVQTRPQPQAQAPPEVTHTQPSHFQLHFPIQPQMKPQAPTQTLHLTVEQQRNLQSVSAQLQVLSTVPNPNQQQKQLMDRFQQIQHSIILQAKHQASVSQAPTTLNQFNNHSSSMLVSSQGQPVTVAMPAQPQTHMNAPVPLPSQPPVSTAPGPSEITPVHGKSQGQGGQPAQLAALLQQTSVLVKTSAAATPTPLPVDSKAFSGATPPLQGKAIPGQVKPGTQLPIQQPIQAKTGVISSVLSLSLPKGPLQIQVVEKGLSQLLPAVPVQTQQQFDTKVGNLVKKPPAIHPSKEARLLEHLRRHQGAVLQPDHRTPFRSFQDALHRLLPYHVYQGTLPSDQDNRKVDEDFEEVSTQLLKRTQAMLNKYRLLLLEESRRMSPSAEMVMIDRMFIQEEKTALSLDKKLAKEKPDEYVASTSRAQSLPSSSSSVSPSASGVGHTPEGLRSPSLQTSAQIHPTKLVIKHSGEGSPSVMWAKASPSLDDDEETLPSRSKPPMKTYEARSRIGLKLKIKQEAGLSKVVHNTALDPIHQTAGASSVIKTPDRPVGAIPPATPCQMNGTTDHMTLTPAEKKPMATYCRLPLRKTYRENVDAFVMDKTPENRMAGEGGKLESPQVPVVVKQEDGSKSMTASHRTEESPRPVTRKEKSEERSRTALLNRSGDALRPLPLDKPASKTDDPAGGLIKDLAEVEEDFYHGIVKSEPPDSLGPELSWEVLPPAKRKKSESFDVDNASFSSDSPQDDSLNEHLQSAIDSILNLQQPQAAGGAAGVNTRTPASSYNSSSSPFSSPVHRTENYLTPNHNGGLGTRTYNR